MGVAVGIGYSLLAWSWRPFFLSIIVFGAMIPGTYPGIVANLSLKWHAFHLLADRGKSLVNAIEEYEHATGALPRTLDQLVPDYLPDVPRTGMSAYPNYEYATESGMCPNDNAWNITILTGEVLNFDMFFYCPKKNYPPDVGGNWVEAIGEWAYLHE